MLKVGERLRKLRGPGAIRTVVDLDKKRGLVELEWETKTKRHGLALCRSWYAMVDDGPPAGYVLARDRKAVRK